MERISPTKYRNFFFFFLTMLDCWGEGEIVLEQGVSKPGCTQAESGGCPMDRASLIGSHPAVSVMESVPWYLESSAGLGCSWSTSCWPSRLGRGLHLTSCPARLAGRSWVWVERDLVSTSCRDLAHQVPGRICSLNQTKKESHQEEGTQISCFSLRSPRLVLFKTSLLATPDGNL